MRLIKLLKNPLVFIPLIAGVLLPCVIFASFQFSRRAAARSQLVLKDAVVISGQPLPKTDLLELDGGKVSPQTLRSGKVLLIFLTTNCPACQKELKLVSSVAPELSGKLQIYGIGFQDASEIKKFVQENGIVTPILRDSHADLATTLGVKYFPTKFLIQDGVIVNTWFGNSLDKADLFAKVGL
jgi:peroxiredoxin